MSFRLVINTKRKKYINLPFPGYSWDRNAKKQSASSKEVISSKPFLKIVTLLELFTEVPPSCNILFVLLKKSLLIKCFYEECHSKYDSVFPSTKEFIIQEIFEIFFQDVLSFCNRTIKIVTFLDLNFFFFLCSCIFMKVPLL